jgi:uncharacterized protein (UPF0332 family)
MTWNDYLNKGLLAAHVTSKAELDDLRAAVQRNLEDAAIEELSEDNRFAIAYQAALLTAKMAIACAGYRVKGQGSHYTTFQVLTLALGGKFKTIAGYLDRCRRQRNDVAYDTEGLVSKSEVEELIRRTEQFHKDVEAWIVTNHSHFA